jgi:hypothetical protein
MSQNKQCEALELSEEQIKKFQENMDHAIEQVAMQEMAKLKKEQEVKRNFGFFGVFGLIKDKQYAA